MKSNCAKTFGSLCLSALLAYSSIAWAFDECLPGDEGNGIEQVTRGNFYNLGLIVSTRATDEPDASIHCVSTYRAFDIITPASFESVRPSFKNLPSTLLPPNSFVVRGVINSLRGRSPPDWVGYSLSSGQRSRYLLLSVFLV